MPHLADVVFQKAVAPGNGSVAPVDKEVHGGHHDAGPVEVIGEDFR